MIHVKQEENVVQHDSKESATGYRSMYLELSMESADPARELQLTEDEPEKSWLLGLFLGHHCPEVLAT